MKKTCSARTRIEDIASDGVRLTDHQLRLVHGAIAIGGGGGGGGAGGGGIADGTCFKTYPGSVTNPGESDHATDTSYD